ncbi:TonB-dependent receptor [Maricurvus nonylphenolicus]|uniref:TonB-dependent receptor n=1 Tax=Maricurvus nonylphenolicus TaxID=1008307 RepID=UPI0036F2FD4A
MFNRTAVFTAISAAMLGYAQTPVLANDDSFALEEIVVTAQKREQNLVDVPVSVQAITGKGLADAGVQDFADLVNVSPSLALQDNLTSWQKSIYIRGVGTTINSPTVESSVSTVLDGVVLARQGQFFSELADIERVEVLRGPQSTLFGKNASAGVLSIVTKRPSLDETEGSVEVGYDEYGEQRMKGTYGAPISDDMAYRLSANYKYSDESHLENVNVDGPDLDGDKGYALRGKLLWEVNDSTDVLFIADYGRNHGPNGVRVMRSVGDTTATVVNDNGTEALSIDEDNRQVNINDSNEYEAEEWGISAEVNWDLDTHALTSITAMRSWDFDNDIDIDSGGQDVPSVSHMGVGTPYFRGIITGNKLSKQYSQEIRLQSTDASDLQYVVGALFWATTYEADAQERRTVCFGAPFVSIGADCLASAPFASLVNLSDSDETEIDTQYYALFGQADYALTDEWMITAGLRVQHDKFEWDKKRLGVLAAGDLPIADYEGSGDVSNTEWTGKLGVQYMLNEESNVYASYARGYKGPGAQIGSAFTEPLEPEIVDAFELGYKGRLMDGRLGINAALFWQDFTDTQVSYYDVVDSAFRPTNAGETRQRGLEVDAMFAATQELNLNASVTYLDGEYKEFETACYVGDTDANCAIDGSKDVAGEVTPYSPDWKIVLGGRYTKAIPGTEVDGFLQLNYRWQSETQYQADQNPLTLQDEYGVFDLSFGLEDQAGRYEVTFYVRNLTDQDYVSNLVAFEDATGANESVVQFVPKAADRYFGGSVKFNF